MKVVAYGRVGERVEVPLGKQRDMCKEWADEEGHEWVGWWEDEEQGDTDPNSRDGWVCLLRSMMRNKADAILVSDWTRVSTDPAHVASMSAVSQMTLGKDVDLWTPDGPVDFNNTEYEEVQRAMDVLSESVEEWRSTNHSVKTKESINKTIKHTGPYAIGKTPHGVIRDKKKFTERSQTYEVVPDDREEDHFREAVEVLNEFAYQETTPYHLDKDPTPSKMASEFDLRRSTIKAIWKHRETYRELAEKFRPELTVLW